MQYDHLIIHHNFLKSEIDLLILCDNHNLARYTSEELIVADGAFVGLAPPGDIGSFQKECKVIFTRQ